MKEIYNSDKPISDKIGDRFNRHSFAQRISETIIRREHSDGLVIGLYGVWGEGKTSILNFIEKEFSDESDIIVVKFNPWRFTSEEKLINNFLNSISTALNLELLNFKERAGNLLKTYGSIGSMVNLDLSKIGENISETDLEILKNRVNDFLKDSRKKLVVIIDDIDRLDKQELFSLFKLVKLAGDFSKTYYILAFDNEMVASAIGERYAEGNINSGHNFLEKIIQVPLFIPKALNKSLLDFTFDLLNQIIAETGLELNEQEEKHLAYNISQYILPKIVTPRLSIRYANSLSFLIPLLKGEVNHCDLILFEAVKIFYPEHYNFIKTNPHYFIDGYDEVFRREKNHAKVEEIKKHLERLSSKLSKIDSIAISKLIAELFPKLKEALHNSYGDDIVLIKNKKIGSPKYFNRYFLYTVPGNEISDVFFDGFIKSLKFNSEDENFNRLTDILQEIDGVEFLNKISYSDELIEWNDKEILINLLVKIEGKFEKIVNAYSFGISSPKSHAAITIYRMINSNSDVDIKLLKAKELMSEPVPFNFSMEILRWLNVGDEYSKMFNREQYDDLNSIMLERALDDCKNSGDNLFDKYSEHIYDLLRFWRDKDQHGVSHYITELINSNLKSVKDILWSLTSEIYSSSNPEPYKIDFKKETYEFVSSLISSEFINQKIQEGYHLEIESEKAFFYDLNKGQHELNVLRQFMHWYNLPETQ